MREGPPPPSERRRPEHSPHPNQKPGQRAQPHRKNCEEGAEAEYETACRRVTALDGVHRAGSSGKNSKTRSTVMKWITREKVKVDRVACPWLNKKFVDPQAEFLFVPTDQVMTVAEREGATPYDVKGVELGHHGQECSFEAILKKYNLTGDAALVLLGKIVNGADTDNTLWNQPEGAGLEAVAEGFRHLGFKYDHELNSAEWIVYDALYAYC